MKDMTWTGFGILAVSVFTAIYIVARAYRENHPVPLTVEQEQEHSREVLGHIPQWQPGITSSDYDEEETFDDPVWHIRRNDKPA